MESHSKTKIDMDQLNSIIDAVDHFHKNCLTVEDMEILPKKFILRLEGRVLESFWDLVSDDLKPLLTNKLPCYTHYNKGPVQIDGPPPIKENCYVCKHY